MGYATKMRLQALGAWIAVIVGSVVVITGVYFLLFGLADDALVRIERYAGGGTFPGDYYKDVITPLYLTDTFVNISRSGITMITGGAILIGAALIRNKITLKPTFFVILVGFGFVVSSIGVFNTAILEINKLVYNNVVYQEDFVDQYQLHLPEMYYVAIASMFVILTSAIVILGASMTTKPIERWVEIRDKFVSAAELEIKNKRLQKAIEYLENASKWSSKVGEEDRSIELLTQARVIRSKEIQYRKSVMAEKMKKKMSVGEKERIEKKMMEESKKKKEKRESVAKEVVEDKKKKGAKEPVEKPKKGEKAKVSGKAPPPPASPVPVDDDSSDAPAPPS